METIWFAQQRKNHREAYPSDTPVRLEDGTLTTLGGVDEYVDVEIHVGNGWSKGARIPPPETCLVEVEIKMEAGGNRAFAEQELTKLLASRDMRDSSILSFTLKKK